MSVGKQGGTQSISNQTDAAIGTSGKPTRVYYAEAVSDGTATLVLLKNGTSTGGTQFSQLDGTISKSVSRYYGSEGMWFPAGCFADVDSHTAFLTVCYSQDVA